VKYDAELHG